ncbi:hypothetical protein H7342_14915 [Nocardioides sp. zg-1228]|nr:hypothetical protein [Nocardioides sp. zg-1228]
MFVFAAMLVPVGPGPAYACSCAYQHTADFVEGADEIFAGTLVSMADPPEHDVMSSADQITYTVAVDAVYQGDVASTTVFESPISGASCGLEGMVVDRRYLVFVSTDGSGRTASLCGGTAPATPGRVNAVERLTGAPAQPAVGMDDAAAASGGVAGATDDDEPAQPAISRWTISTAGIIGVAALLGAGLQLRRRATQGGARQR